MTHLDLKRTFVGNYKLISSMLVKFCLKAWGFWMFMICLCHYLISNKLLSSEYKLKLEYLRLFRESEIECVCPGFFLHFGNVFVCVDTMGSIPITTKFDRFVHLSKMKKLIQYKNQSKQTTLFRSTRSQPFSWKVTQSYFVNC